MQKIVIKREHSQKWFALLTRHKQRVHGAFPVKPGDLNGATVEFWTENRESHFRILSAPNLKVVALPKHTTTSDMTCPRCLGGSGKWSCSVCRGLGTIRDKKAHRCDCGGMLVRMAPEYKVHRCKACGGGLK